MQTTACPAFQLLQVLYVVVAIFSLKAFKLRLYMLKLCYHCNNSHVWQSAKIFPDPELEKAVLKPEGPPWLVFCAKEELVLLCACRFRLDLTFMNIADKRPTNTRHEHEDIIKSVLSSDSNIQQKRSDARGGGGGGGGVSL